MKYDIILYDAQGKECNRVGSYPDYETATQISIAFLQSIESAQSYKIIEYPT